MPAIVDPPTIGTSERLLRAAHGYAGSIARLVRGEPVTTPPLKSATVGARDVAIAHRYLRDPAGGWLRGAVGELEHTFAQWNGSSEVVALASGRVALSACLDALGVASGDEILVPAYTCLVVVNAIRFCGAEPVYVDIESDTYGMDATAARGAFTSRTRGVVVQHLYGLVSRDHAEIIALARARSVPVVEDCAQALGATLHGRRVGTFGDLGVYSSGNSKVIDTCQGGLAVTDDEELGRRLRGYAARARAMPSDTVERLVRTHLLNWHEHAAPRRALTAGFAEVVHGAHRLPGATPDEIAGRMPPGYATRMPDVVARLALSQLAGLEAHARRRRQAAAHWELWCRRVGLRAPLVLPGSVPAFPSFPVMVDPDRKSHRRWTLERLGVRSAGWFEEPPDDAAIRAAPRAALAYSRCICLPTSTNPPSGGCGRGSSTCSTGSTTEVA